jgi:hypothetical protein
MPRADDLSRPGGPFGEDLSGTDELPPIVLSCSIASDFTAQRLGTVAASKPFKPMRELLRG